VGDDVYGGQVAHPSVVQVETLPLDLTPQPTPEHPRPTASSATPNPPAPNPPAPHPQGASGGPIVEVRRSPRRRRSVSAHREGERTIVMIPARMSRAEEAEWVEVMLRRLEEQERRSKPSDGELLARAHRLSRAHLAGRAVVTSVRWVGNQRTRWGSCTVDDRSIRLSDRLQPMPEWVVDYVLLHELAHLIEPSHNDRFWALLQSYPDLERARGFLDGWSLGLQHVGASD
jgi:predicted metal-dependent hydrolase